MSASFDQCPKAWLRDTAPLEVQLVGDALFFREHRALPNAGGMLDQDPRFLEALTIVDGEVRALQQAAANNGR